MKKDRMLAFTDGVFAVIITIMVLELKVPHEATFEALRPVGEHVSHHVLSFIYIGIYWNNHHHLHPRRRNQRQDPLGKSASSVLALVIPFVTGWVATRPRRPAGSRLRHRHAHVPGLAYSILQSQIIRHHGKESELGQAIGRDFKGKASVALYIAAIAASFFLPVISVVCCAIPAALWFIPDRRIEARLGE